MIHPEVDLAPPLLEMFKTTFLRPLKALMSDRIGKYLGAYS